MPINKPVVYCPGKDREFKGMADSMILTFANIHDTALWGGEGGLDALTSTAKLYFLAHSHYFFAKFNVNGWTWTAAEIADMLVSDGLSREHRDIELLVCCAGLSTVSKSLQAKMTEAARLYKKAQDEGKDKDMKKYMNQYNRLWEQADVPREYSSANQVLPLACELMQEMKVRKFKKLAITSYKGAIAATFAGGFVRLDLKFAGLGYGMPATDYPDRKVVWK